MKKSALLTVILWLCSGCGHGTNTGNPYTTKPAGTGMSVALVLVDDTCSRIAFCFPAADVNACVSQASILNGYTSQLGTPADTFQTMTDLSEAEVNHTVAADFGNTGACRTAIHEVGCTDPLMLLSYDVHNPTSYAATNALFGASPSCRQIYQSVPLRLRRSGTASLSL